jgi:hypothetical protein
MAIPSKNIRAERIKGTLDASEFDVSGDLIINGNLSITGTASISTINPSSTTASIFLTTEGDEVRSRTADEVLIDIGAQAALTNPVTGTGSTSQISFWTGTTSQSGDSDLIWDDMNKILEVSGEVLPSVEKWTFDFTDGLGITIYADDNFTITEISNILNSPKIDIKVNNINYNLGDPINLGSRIDIQSNIQSVIKLKIVKI